MPEVPEWLIRESEKVTYLKGDKILEFHAKISYVYVINKGTVLIYNMSVTGQENKIVFVKQGGIIGEMETIIGKETMQYSAKAFTKCELICIPPKFFIRWIQTDQIANWQFIRVLSQKLSNAAWQSSQYISCDGTKRLIAFLSQQDEGRVSYTRNELAEACSVSLRTINRCTGKLYENGKINLVKGKINLTGKQLSELREYMINDLVEE